MKKDKTMNFSEWFDEKSIWSIRAFNFYKKHRYWPTYYEIPEDIKFDDNWESNINKKINKC